MLPEDPSSRSDAVMKQILAQTPPRSRAAGTTRMCLEPRATSAEHRGPVCRESRHSGTPGRLQPCKNLTKAGSSWKISVWRVRWLDVAIDQYERDALSEPPVHQPTARQGPQNHGK